tara:strand:- start:934 stop:1242 length:309 start_codon:yes stop_codon:yes gene_type:complete
MENDYPPSGTLFMSKNKRSERSPDYTGQFEINHEVVEDLAKQMKNGVKKPIFSMVGWKKYSDKTGTSFLSLRGNVYEPPVKRDNEIPKEVIKSIDEIDEIKF